MPEFLTIAGINVEISAASTGERTPVRIGGSSRAIDGTMRNTVRAIFREWSYDTTFLSAAQEALLRAACDGGAFVAVSGSGVGGGTVTCLVDINEAPYHMDGATAVNRTLSLDIRQAV